MNNLAIIPARGGSKRIPRKNIKDFLGKPIIAYSIEVAKSSGLFEEIMVSTDDEQIAKIAQEYGAKVPFMRSAENADDHAPVADVIKEVYDFYQKKNRTFSNLCCIFATAPLITTDSLKQGLDILIKQGFDSVRPVCRFSYPIQRAFKLDGHKVKFMQLEHLKTRSQDLEPAYHDAGQFYWMKAQKLLEGQNRGAFILPETHVQDIDSEEDFKIAELKYKLIHQ